MERSPISEACQGVVTTLHRLGASVDGEGLSCRLHLELVGIWFLKIGLAYCPAYVSVLFSFAYGNGNALRFFFPLSNDNKLCIHNPSNSILGRVPPHWRVVCIPQKHTPSQAGLGKTAGRERLNRYPRVVPKAAAGPAKISLQTLGGAEHGFEKTVVDTVHHSGTVGIPNLEVALTHLGTTCCQN